jgi:hypothetical protein
MPKTKVFIYRNEEGSVPVIEWLKKQPQKVQDRCTAMIELLAASGYELRRPYADYLDNGIYELRPTVGRVHYRILYSFAGKNVVLVTHGLVKVDRVPKSEIIRASEFRDRFIKNPLLHSYETED